MSVDKLDFNTTANVKGEWFINENLDLIYFFVFASDSPPSDTSTNVDSDQWSVVDALTSLHAPIKSSFMVHKKTSDAQGAFFEVPSKRKGQSQFYSGELSLNRWLTKARKMILSSHSSLIMSQMHVIWGEYGVRLDEKVRLEFWPRKMNTAPFFCPKREGSWLLSSNSEGVRLRVNSKPIRLRAWGIIISQLLIRRIIMGIRYQCRHYLW